MWDNEFHYEFVVESPGGKQLLQLTGELLSLGRSPECDFVIPSHAYAEKQVVFEKSDEDSWVAKNLDENRSLLINGQEIPPKHQARIHFPAQISIHGTAELIHMSYRKSESSQQLGEGLWTPEAPPETIEHPFESGSVARLIQSDDYLSGLKQKGMELENQLQLAQAKFDELTNEAESLESLKSKKLGEFEEIALEAKALSQLSQRRLEELTLLEKAIKDKQETLSFNERRSFNSEILAVKVDKLLESKLSEFVSFSHDFSELTQAAQRAEDRLNRLQKEADFFIAENTERAELKASLDRDILARKGELENLRVSINDLWSRQESLREEISESQSLSESLFSELQSKKASLQQLLDSLGEISSEISLEKESLRELQEEKRKSSLELDQSHLELNKAIEEFEQLSLQSRHLSGVEHWHAESVQSHMELMSESEVLEKKNAELKNAKEGLIAELDKLEQSARDSSLQEEELKLQIEQQEKALSVLLSELEQKESKLNEVSTQYSEATDLLKSAESDVNSLNLKLRRLQQNIVEAENKKEALESELRPVELEHGQNQERLRAVNEKLDLAKKHFENVNALTSESEDRNRALREENEEYKKIQANLENAVFEKRAEKERAESECSQSLRLLEAQKIKVQEEESILVSLKASIESLEGQKHELRTSIDNSEAVLRQNEQQSAALLEKIELQRAHHDELLESADRVAARESALQASIEKMKVDYDRSHADFEDKSVLLREEVHEKTVRAEEAHERLSDVEEKLARRREVLSVLNNDIVEHEGLNARLLESKRFLGEDIAQLTKERDGIEEIKNEWLKKIDLMKAQINEESQTLEAAKANRGYELESWAQTERDKLKREFSEKFAQQEQDLVQRRARVEEEISSQREKWLYEKSQRSRQDVKSIQQSVEALFDAVLAQRLSDEDRILLKQGFIVDVEKACKEVLASEFVGESPSQFQLKNVLNVSASATEQALSYWRTVSYTHLTLPTNREV